MVGNDRLSYIAVYSRGIVQGKQDKMNIAVVTTRLFMVLRSALRLYKSATLTQTHILTSILQHILPSADAE